MSLATPNGRPANGRGHPPSPEAEQLFQVLAGELEEGTGDPEALFAAHPVLETDLRGLYRGWLEADALLRSLAGDESLVGAARRDLCLDGATEREDEALARLASTSFERRYALGEELGHGGMGIVRRVTDRTLGRELAMKVIRPVEPGRRRRLLRRFLEEAEVIGRLEHPGIVPIHELGLDPDGQVYFTMPLVRGRTLKEILPLARDGRESWTRVRVLEVLLRVCDALAYAHSRGVLHRDLKPANVMVGRFGEVFVMDWGLARSLGTPEESDGTQGDALADSALTLDGEVLGTPAYMAPEQAFGHSGRLDERCDVYALGAILYELLTGARPYGECTSEEALARLAREAPAPVERQARRGGEELHAIVRRAMARERAERYPSVTALAADLRAFLEGRVVLAHSTGPWVEARKWIQRNRRLAAALVLAGLALAGGLVVALVLLRAAERERDNVFRLAQTRTLVKLIERADELWPAYPGRIEELRAWQAEARSLVSVLEPDLRSGKPGLRQQLAQLRAREASWGEEDRWWHEELVKLVGGIEELADPTRGLLEKGLGPRGHGIGKRLILAERLRSVSERPEVQALWREARDSLRSDPRFAGLELAPEVGLVPLGKDPASQLWEFAHVLTGEVPHRAPDGRLQVGPESGLVLVLVPGGPSWMGSQREDPSGHNYDKSSGEYELPLTFVQLEPFLLSKFEMTQAQWQRATGRNPSFHQGEADTDRLPVEQVSWTTAREELHRLGLRLPAEAEWEHACRAGTRTPYSFGEEPGAFVRHANVRDQSLEDLMGSQEPVEPFRDGFGFLAPVGSFLPNAWGFHDAHGNVFEWCEDPLTPPDSEAASEERFCYVFRGGSFQRILSQARASQRGGEIPSFAYRAVGVRPAARLHGPAE